MVWFKLQQINNLQIYVHYVQHKKLNKGQTVQDKEVHQK